MFFGFTHSHLLHIPASVHLFFSCGGIEVLLWVMMVGEAVVGRCGKDCEEWFNSVFAVPVWIALST
jgi:hypothetical protein